MRIYRVFNGYTGFDPVHRIAVAETPEQAIWMALALGMKKTNSMEAEDIFPGVPIRVGLCETQDWD